MNRLTFISISLLLFLGSCAEQTINCTIETSLGTIELELYPEKAPITVANFLRYVDDGLYDNTSFFRTCTKENEADRRIKIEVIQAADMLATELFPPIAIETTQTTKLLHKNGTVSMARDTPNSAQSSFFICINDQPELDYKGKRNPDGQGFAAFGQVTKGMEVVLKIQQQPNKDQMLIEPVKIYSIKRK